MFCDVNNSRINKFKTKLTNVSGIQMNIELLQLITANVLSVLYYNSEIWHIPSLKNELKKKLTSISAKAIKTCMYYPDNMISFENIHKMNNRAMPEAFMTYKIAIQLHKLFNASNPTLDWISLNFDQILTTRQTQFLISKSNKHKVGLNILPNRFSVLNGLIPLSWLNYNIDTFKIHIKKLLLSTWSLTMALHACNLTLRIRDHILKFKMYIMCGSLSQINHSNLTKSELDIPVFLNFLDCWL